MSTKDKDAFRNLYRDRLEKRIVEHLEAIIEITEHTTKDALQSQLALIGRSLEGIALMLAEQGYVNNRGAFVSFTPSDILTIQQALGLAIKLRSDVLMTPFGAEGVAKVMSSLDKSASKSTEGNPHTGLQEPPQMVAVDTEQPLDEQPSSTIKDQPDVMRPVMLPAKLES